MKRALCMTIIQPNFLQYIHKKNISYIHYLCTQGKNLFHIYFSARKFIRIVYLNRLSFLMIVDPALMIRFSFFQIRVLVPGIYTCTVMDPALIIRFSFFHISVLAPAKYTCTVMDPALMIRFSFFHIRVLAPAI